MRTKVLKRNFLVVCLVASIAISVVALRAAAVAAPIAPGAYLTGICPGGFYGNCAFNESTENEDYASLFEVTNPTGQTLCELIYTFTEDGYLNYCSSYELYPFNSVQFEALPWTVGVNIVSAAPYNDKCPDPGYFDRIYPVAGLQAWESLYSDPPTGLPFYTPQLSQQTLYTLASDCYSFEQPASKTKK